MSVEHSPVTNVELSVGPLRSIAPASRDMCGGSAWVVTLLAIAALLCQVSLASAERAPTQVLIRVYSSTDQALLERIRGQVSDLDVALVVDAGEWKPAMGVKARVWFTRTNPKLDRVTVHMLFNEAGATRSLTRQVGGGGAASNEALSSATLEAAALVVRGALVAVSQPEPRAAEPDAMDTRATGPPAADAAAGAEASARESVQRDAVPSESIQRDAALTGWGISSGARWEVVIDGEGSLERTGPRFSVGGSFRRFELLAFAAFSLQASARNQYGTINLRRYVLGVRLGRAWLASESIAVDPGVILVWPCTRAAP